ncbi:energy transducer TonB [Haemophilus influenzae]|uniref:Protein TonB n=1 Tax=Haemophilus influenzae (strain NTHi 3655) TaxID=375177 RepID=A0A0H3PIA0_HAEI3|nr:energy transducer TonB [Haemophilus influenzae]AXP45810.1 energy transducer TonB [Haemophilus influenzae]AXP64660.1 energy transducer TonB [Haemophilus influenzae]EDJ93241.1 TonB [Haemophilus influenzae 3655]KIP38535.1 energy transducer TonB [Haemophilus influenzae]KOR02416.1 energy transducer TonB [Haemophilus influenzae]
MQQTKRSLLGLLISLIVHGIVIGFILWNWNKPSDSANSAQGDISTSISMELLQGMVLEEPAPEPENVQKEPEPEPEKQEIVEDPTIKPEPKKIKEPEKEKPKPKEKPKEKPENKPKKEVKPQQKPINKDLPKGDKNIDSSANVNDKASTTSAANSNAQVAGSGTDTSEIAAYRSAIRREIESHKRYPTRAKIMRKQGKVSVSFNVGADGSLSGARVTKSSGDESLDKAALDAINVSRSVGARPAGFPSSLSVQISFTLQ